MLGLFDSGSGGLNTVRYVKELSDDVDLVYLIDRENAPYGIKTEKELIVSPISAKTQLTSKLYKRKKRFIKVH